MNLDEITGRIAGTRIGLAQYVVRSIEFLLRSQVQERLRIKLWGFDYQLRANKRKLGVDGYLYIFREEYEPELRSALFRHFDDGDLFIDIGANSGYWSRFVACNFAESKIIAFEPARRTFELLENNVSVHSDRIVAKNVAVSDSEQSSFLSIMADPGSNFLTSDPGEHAEAVQTVTLDNELKRSGDGLRQHKDHCVLKIDVEGFELQVLKGAREFIRSMRPTIIFELLGRHLDRAGVDPNCLFNYVSDLGYETWSLSQPSSKMESASDMLRNQGNFIAVRC